VAGALSAFLRRADDFRCTRKRPTLHFWEWFAAIHIVERGGAYSLVDKNHSVKRARLASILSASRQDTLLATLKRHEAIARRLGAPVEVPRFSLTAGQRTSA